MPQLTTAGRLLADLYADQPGTRDSVATAAGLALAHADSAMGGGYRLTLSEQLRLAEATILFAPDHSRLGWRLRAQALAAHSYESGDVQTHANSRAERWERTPSLRRS